MRYLRKNTAVRKAVGPFRDKTDGVTLETALTITNEKITLVAETDDGAAPTLVLDNVTGATSGTANDLNYITGQDNGMMEIEFSAANTNRNGSMRLTITDAVNHVPVVEDFTILPEWVYDCFILGLGMPELPVGLVAATPRPDQAMMTSFMAQRNQHVTDTPLAEERIYNDAGACIMKKTISDSQGVFTAAKMVTGP